MALNGDSIPAAQRASQIRIHLKSRDGDIELPPNTGSILVSTDFRRYQLSTLVNRLLDTEKPIPLEFLVNGEYLLTSLDDFLTRNGISAETVLNVEYVKAFAPPQHVASYEHDEWVHTVDVLSDSSDAAQWSGVASTQGRILTGAGDNTVRVWDLNSEVVASACASPNIDTEEYGFYQSVTTAKFITPTQIASSGDDGVVRIWEFSDPGVGSGSLTPSVELYGQGTSISKLAVHAPSSRILTAGGERVGVWTSDESKLPAMAEGEPPASTKRRKLSGKKPSVARGGHLAMLRGHKRRVLDVCFDRNDATVGYSVSSDHTLKTWDLVTGADVDTKILPDALHSVCHIPERSLVAVGSDMRYISIVDVRASAATSSIGTLRGHTNVVSAIARDPGSNDRIVSASHDGTCRIWDIRSMGRSVYVIQRESTKGQKVEPGDEAKVFSVCWNREVGIASGGKDKIVQINKASSEE